MAGLAELVDAPDLKSVGNSRIGSIPITRTKGYKMNKLILHTHEDSITHATLRVPGFTLVMTAVEAVTLLTGGDLRDTSFEVDLGNIGQGAKNPADSVYQVDLELNEPDPPELD